MRLTALAAGITLAAVLTVGSPVAAHAQTKTTNNHKAQIKVAQKVQSKKVTVSEGDTLSAIATDNGMTYQRLYDANTNISDPDLIYPGDNIRIPDPSEQITHRDLPVKAVATADAQAQTLAATTQPQQPQVVSTPVAAPAAPAPTPQISTVSGCGDNQYANYIYMHESGCNTGAMSPNGCYGIGQACPASKVTGCGTDYACQDAYFNSYANKYGGWAGAYAFWTSHGWW